MVAESPSARSGNPAKRAASEEKTERRRERARAREAREKLPTPQWYKVLMVVLLVVGLFWVIIYYATLGAFPIPAIGAWNIAVGFGISMVGFLMTTQWRG